ncbi:MAG: T9SS type A sorting domain-containing protein [Bacteroidia bacterium]
MEKVKHYIQLVLMAVLMAVPVWGFGQSSLSSDIAGNGDNESVICGAAWNNASGATQSGNGQIAQVNLPGGSCNGNARDNSQYLLLKNFNTADEFKDIPSNAVITGIQVEILAGNGANTYDSAITLARSQSFVGTSKQISGEWNTQAFPAVTRTYGGSSDLWGTTWTAADFKSSNFGIGISVRADTTGGKTASPYVDGVEITVYFSPIDYYYDGTGDVQDTSNWDTNPDTAVVGIRPSGFGESNVRFNLVNTYSTTPDTVVLDSAWSITGAGSTLQIGSQDPLIATGWQMLTVHDGIILNADVRINNRGTLNSEQIGAGTFTLLNMRPLGRLQYTGAGNQSIPSLDTIYNLTIGGSGIKTFEATGEIIFKEDFTFAGTAKARLSSNQVLIAPNSSSEFIGYGPDNYIITGQTGYLRQQVVQNADSVIYPLGTSTGFTPIYITVGSNGQTNHYEARVIGDVYNDYNNGQPTGSAIGSNTVLRSWIVNRTNTDNTDDTRVTLLWNDTDERGDFNRDSANIAFFFSGGWNIPAGPEAAVAGPYPDTYMLSRDSLGIFDNTPFGVGDMQSPLPVELTSFTAVKVEDHVQLDWNTASELNNKGFEVQRSRDLKEWSKLGFVEGTGTTMVPQSYRFHDDAPMSGINYYRLRQVDYNGEYAYSGVVAVDFAGSFVIDIFPNPAKGGSVNINMNNRDNEKMDVRLINIHGQEVLNQSTYDTNMKLNVESIPNGNYILTVRAGNQIENRKISIIR